MSAPSLDVPASYRTRVWHVLLAAVLGASFVAGAELWLRSVGGRPISDSEVAWYQAQREIGEDDVLVLGSSRALTGIEARTLERAGGQKVRQLSLTSGSGIVLLEHVLETQPGFRGVVLLELVPAIDFGGEADERTEDAIAWRSRLQVGAYLEELLQDALNRRFAVRNWAVAPRVLLRVPGHPNLDLYVLQLGEHTLDDRQLVYPFEDYDAGQLERYTALAFRGVGEHPDPRRFEQQRQRLAEAVAELHGRGGRVVLLRMPSSGVVREWEAERFPRAERWEVVAGIEGVVALHYADDPETRLEPPDGSHLSRAQARRYTKALLRALELHGVEPWARAP